MTHLASPISAQSFGNQPVRRAIRQLRWFKSSFLAQVNAVSEQTGIEFETNTEVLARCFLAWLKPFESSKPDDPDKREAFVGYAAGLMLRQMIELKPLRHISIPEPLDRQDPAKFWPEGFVYVSYCLNVRRLVLSQEFEQATDTVQGIPDIGTWWSFRENVEEMSSYAMSFLDLFAGIEPDFESPGVFDRTLIPRAPVLSSPVRHQLPDAASVDEGVFTFSSPASTGSSTVAHDHTENTAARLHAFDEELQLPGREIATAIAMGIGWSETQLLVVDDDCNVLEKKHIASGYRTDGVLELAQLAGLKEALAKFVDPGAESSATAESSSKQEFPGDSTDPPLGVFITVPDSARDRYPELRSAIASFSSCDLWILGAASAAAMAEITFGAGRMIPTFLMIHTEDMLEYKLVQNGSICAGARKSPDVDVTADHASNRVSNRISNQTANKAQHPATSNEEFQTLLGSIGTLIDLFGLEHVIISPSEKTVDSQTCKDLIGKEFPQLSVRYSDISGSSLALCAACLQFVSLQKSNPGP